MLLEKWMLIALVTCTHPVKHGMDVHGLEQRAGGAVHGPLSGELVPRGRQLLVRFLQHRKRCVCLLQLLWAAVRTSVTPNSETVAGAFAARGRTCVSTWWVRRRLAVVDCATATASASLRMAALRTRPSAVPRSCLRSSAAALVACTCSACHWVCGGEELAL